MPFPDDHTEKSVLTVINLRCGQMSSRYKLPELQPQQAGSTHSENRTTEWPGHSTHSGGSWDQTAPRIERHRLLQPHIQKLLGPMEIPHCEERHSRAPLGICQWTMKNTPLDQGERHTDQTIRWTVRSSEYKKTLDKVQRRYCWLQARNNVEKGASCMPPAWPITAPNKE
jgi:hypothetical protein